jgi:hypothetical protein
MPSSSIEVFPCQHKRLDYSSVRYAGSWRKQRRIWRSPRNVGAMRSNGPPVRGRGDWHLVVEYDGWHTFQKIPADAYSTPKDLSFIRA